MAAGVILGGIGILVTGVLIGSTDRAEPDAETVAPLEKVSTSIAHVTVENGNAMPTMVTGLVLDDDGNLLVPADAIAQSDEIWARCADGTSERVEVVGTDAQTNLAVLRIAMSDGTPALASTVAPDVGTEVVTVHAREGTGLSMRNGVVAATDSSGPDSSATPTSVTADPTFWAEVDLRPEKGPTSSTTNLSGGLVFDRGGRFVGMTTASGGATPRPAGTPAAADMSFVRVMPADAALRTADRIITGS
jgi:S1-C subfamily serine protease